ncbi:MAG TPA: hypothetical protein VG265_02980 [Gaiellaceae bacterium]|jgi:hypothetical protein|nr:hypothetical protein [Gaiellaceae bacterium]
MPASGGDHAGPQRVTSRAGLTRFVPWIALVLGVLAFYWVEAALRKGPWVFSDELEWTQLSRAIAKTGHAARRTSPHSFESLYSYLIAPAWWIHSNATAYAAIKYLNSVVMCLTAVPTFLLARMLVPRRTAVVVALLSIAIPSMTYATSIVPEPLAYLWFVTAALLAVKALSAPTPKNVAAAALLAVAGPLIRSEFLALPAILVVSAAFMWILRGGSGTRRLRRVGLSVGVLAIGGYLFNRLVVMHVQSWNTSQYFNHATLGQGGVAAGALAIGLGMGPLIGGLASLWLPERGGDPVYRAFAVYLGSAIVTCWVYTAAKATYVQTLSSLRSLIEERNLFFLSPLLLLGTAMVLGARRVNWLAVGAAVVLAVAVVWSNRLEVGAPYYEAQGLAIPTLLNRNFIFTVQDVHAVLLGVVALTLAFIAMRRRSWVAPLAAVLAAGWLLTGEIYDTKANIDPYSTAEKLPAPRSWIDDVTHGAPTTFLGVQLVDATPVWLTEFWNRSIDHVYAIDDSAPPPGPIAAPFLLSTDGALADYTGNRYTVASPGVDLAARPLAQKTMPGTGVYTLYSTPHPWRLRDEFHNITTDGWGLNPFEYTYFPPGGPGTLRIDLSRTGAAISGPPGRATVEVGSVKLDSNGDPELGKRWETVHATVPNGGEKTVVIHVASSPVTVRIVVTPTVPLSVDSRNLAAQPAFFFKRDP